MEGTQEDIKSRAALRRTGPPRQNGPSIKALREKDGWSQQALAAAVGIRQGTLSLIEREVSSARVTTLNTIARNLRVPVSAIMRELGAAQGEAAEDDQPEPAEAEAA
jgi:transcriptional regulator with XRE-family HTH domain